MRIFFTKRCAHLLHDIIKNPIDFQGARSKVKVTGLRWSPSVPPHIISVWWLKKVIHIFYRNGVHGLWMIFQRTLLLISSQGQRSRSRWKGRLEVHLRCYLCVPDGIWMKSCKRPKENCRKKSARSLLIIRSQGERSRSHSPYEFHLDRHTRVSDDNSIC